MDAQSFVFPGLPEDGRRPSNPPPSGESDMAGTSECGCIVDISPNVANGILTASVQAFQASMADGVRSGAFNMGALQSVALKNLDEVGAVESRATDKVMGP